MMVFPENGRKAPSLSNLPFFPIASGRVASTGTLLDEVIIPKNNVAETKQASPDEYCLVAERGLKGLESREYGGSLHSLEY